jgi:serine/threonine-protein kinase SRPK3
VKIADMGNATPASKHYTEDIQTRQYRAPEAIIGRTDWGFTADVWSVACLTFELLTAEYLFDPQGQGELFSRDVDHYAQIIELLGDVPTSLKMGGRYSTDIFDSDGELRGIKKQSLKIWPLERVMTEKYLWSAQDAREFCRFLIPMLRVDWRERSTAGEATKDEWLEVNPGDWGDELEGKA